MKLTIESIGLEATDGYAFAIILFIGWVTSTVIIFSLKWLGLKQ